MGGEHPIQIESVRVLAGGEWKNYREHFAALFWFDAVCNGAGLNGMKPALHGQDVSFLSALLNEDGAKQPEYVRDCFHLYRLSKTSMVINMNEIEDTCLSDIRSLFFDECVGEEEDKYETTTYWDIEGRSNIVKESVLRFFPNVQQLMVVTTKYNGKKSYPFSLRTWLKLFSTLSLKKCTLNGVWKDAWDIQYNGMKKRDGRRSWLFELYPWIQLLEQDAVKFEQYAVKFELTAIRTRLNFCQDSLTFERL